MKLYSKQQMIKNTLTGILAGAICASAAFFAVQKNLKSENSEKTSQTQTGDVQNQQNSEKAEFVEEVLPQKNIVTPAASPVSQYTRRTAEHKRIRKMQRSSCKHYNAGYGNQLVFRACRSGRRLRLRLDNRRTRICGYKRACNQQGKQNQHLAR